MRVISEQQSTSVITHEIAFDAIKEALKSATEGAHTFPVVACHSANPNDIFLLKSATTNCLTGVKIGSFWPNNLDHGLPRHGTTTILIDPETGQLKALIEAAVVNAYRTAASDAVAAAYLAREDSSRLTIFGAGHQAYYECLALAKIRPIKEVNVVARDPHKAETFCAELREKGLSATYSEAEKACKNADIIVTATTATAPLFKSDWVNPGTHIASMGSDTVGKQELPPELFTKARLFCDLPEQSRNCGEFQHAEQSHHLTAIGDVIAGRAEARLNNEEITIYDSSGLSVQDLYIADAVLKAIPE